jgi:hypothetical protein
MKVVVMHEITDEEGRNVNRVRVIRKYKPRNGGGVTLAEFSNADGRGMENANKYCEEKGHDLT